MNTQELDPRVLLWLREEQPPVRPTTLAAVIDHARMHPRSHRIDARRVSNSATSSWSWLGQSRPRFLLGGAALALAVVGVLVTGLQPGRVGPGTSPTGGPSPSASTVSSPTTGSPPNDLAGTWFGTLSRHVILLTLRDCAEPGGCGTLEWVTDERERCVYGLAYGSIDAESVDVSTTTRFPTGCGSGPWPNETMTLSHDEAGDVLRLQVPGDTVRSVALRRAALVEPTGDQGPDGSPRATAQTTGIPTPMPGRLPDAMVGTWMSTQFNNYPLLMTLHDCAAGETCGVLERVDDNGEHCIYSLEYESTAPGGINVTTSNGNSFGCAWSGWSMTELLLRSTTAGLSLQQGAKPAIDLVRAAM